MFERWLNIPNHFIQDLELFGFTHGCIIASINRERNKNKD